MELSVIDLGPYLEISSELGSESDSSNLDPVLRALCEEVSRTLRETGALVVKDPRCSAQDNDRFIDMMENYFEKTDEFKRLQERPQLHYQVLYNSEVPFFFWLNFTNYNNAFATCG